MKFIHISDLHIGKILNKHDLNEDIAYALSQITDYAAKNSIDAVLISGDIYDNSTPSVASSKLFDCFLTTLCSLRITVIIISGNHDPREKIEFGKSIFSYSNIFISGVYRRGSEPVILQDQFGEVRFYPVPYVREIELRNAFGDERVKSLADGFRCIVDDLNIDSSYRNVMLLHQFVMAGSEPKISGSEAVGTINAVSCDIFEQFDYLALGHIHYAQKIGRRKFRYCGAPMKFAVDEAGERSKSFTVVNLLEKKNITVQRVILKPLHEILSVTGYLEELRIGKVCDDYVFVRLLDKQRQVDALPALIAKYTHLLGFVYEEHERNVHSIKNDETKILFEKNDIKGLFKQYLNVTNGGSFALNDTHERLINEILTEVVNETYNS